MNDCLSTEAIVSIGDALGWDIAEGLRHLKTCDDCGAAMETLRLTREAFLQTAPVDAAVLQRIAASMGVSAEHERRRARVAMRWTEWMDAGIAGLAALLVLVSSRVPIDDAGTALLAFTMGAVLMVVGRVLARRVSPFAPDGARV